MQNSDRINAEREAMAKARQDQLKKEARENYFESLKAKEERLRAEKAAEKAEAEKIEKYHKEKEMLIEQEKAKIIAQHQFGWPLKKICQGKVAYFCTVKC